MSKKFSDTLKDLEHRSQQSEPLTVQAIFDTVGTSGQLMLVLILSVPFLQPIPMFGLSSVFGSVIGLVGIGIFLGKPPWLPQKLRVREIPPALVQRICHGGEKFFEWIEKFVRPRGGLLHRNPALLRVAGAMIVVNAFLLALPLPIPATNIVPSVPTVLIAIGTVEEDDLLIGLGYLTFVLSLAFFVVLVASPYYIYRLVPGLQHWVQTH
jgi:hypothetical protein